MKHSIILFHVIRFFGLVLWIFLPVKIYSQQLSDEVSISFGIKTWDPIHIKVNDASPLRFIALNSTYYPFNITVDFSVFENLSPKPPPREIKLNHGINNLFTISEHVPDRGYNYRYTYTYSLAPSDEIIDEKFPYLVPLSKGKEIISKRRLYSRINNSFTGNAWDTAFCMRKGLVVAVPKKENLDFRLSGPDCLEILHEDGTYMIYRNLSKDADLVSPGKTVFPGEPVGLISDSLYLTVSLIRVVTKNIFMPVEITYINSSLEIVPFDALDGKERAFHPFEVITRELKGNELKKLKKR
jgi:hypothetical protein